MLQLFTGRCDGMKVIFIKDLKKQGRVNEVKEVSDGYAVNFLIKNGYAVKYTKTSSDILKEDIKSQEKENAKLSKEASDLKKVLEGMILEFRVKSHQGKMFGSVSSKQISDELKKRGISIDKKCVDLNSPLSSLGMHEVDCKLYKKIVAKLRVNLLEK